MKLSDLNKPIQLKRKLNSHGNKYEDLLKKPINLLPEKSVREKRSDFIKNFALAFIVAILFITLIATAYLSFERTRLTNDIGALNATLELQKDRIGNQGLLDLLMNRIDYKSELVDYIKTTNKSALAVLNAVETYTSSDMKYLTVNFVSRDTLSISGLSSNTDAIATLLHKLKLLKDPKDSGKPFFETVLVESITQSVTGNGETASKDLEFVLICSFGGQEDAVKK